MSLIIVSKSEVPRPFECLICGDTFTTAGAQERHIVGTTTAPGCATRNEDVLREMSFRARAPELFDPQVSGDVELGRWIRDNQRALIEGRMRL